MLNPLNNVRNLKDPLKQFVSTWNLSFPAGSPLGQIITTDKVKDLELRCQTYGMPTLTGDTTDVTWGGFARRYAGKQTRQGSWSVNFIEVWDAQIIELFKQWLNYYHQYKNGTISLLKEYTATVNVSLVNPDVYDLQSEGHSATKYDIRLYDVFPMEANLPEISASSSEAVEIGVNFNFNYFLLGDEIEG